MDKHPCYDDNHRSCYGRIHLPVAPKCNIQCGYCDRKYDCVNESRPGVTSKVMTHDQVVDHIKRHNTPVNNIKVIGIAGPGEPLYNPETFKTLKVLDEEFKQFIKCISTNGLLLEDKLEQLIKYNVSAITVTLNTLNSNTAKMIYDYTAGYSYEEFIQKQINGIVNAVNEGVAVKINTVAISSVNLGEIEEIAQFAYEVKATVMNVTSLIPQAKFAGYKKISSKELQYIREVCSKYIKQLYGCSQCRADAVGIPNKI